VLGIGRVEQSDVDPDALLGDDAWR